MGKKRMLELAKVSKEKVTDLVNLAKKLDIEVKNAMSSVSDEDAKKILNNLDKIAETKSEKKSLVKKIIEKNVDVEQSEPKVEPKTEQVEKVEKTVEVKTETATTPKQETVKPQVAADEKETSQVIEIGKNAKNFSSHNNQNRNNDRGNYNNQNRGNYNNDRGNYNNRNDNRSGNNNQNRNYQGQNQGQNRGGYNNQNQGQNRGGYNNNQNRGGYNNQNQGQNRGGYNNQNQGQNRGGYNNQNRGGYNNQNQGQNRGGYNNQNQGQNRGGYNNQNRGGYNNQNQGQNRGGYNNNQNRGGYNQNRGGNGMDNRNIDRKLNDISASTVTDATKPSRNYNDNKERRNYGEERKSKKQLKEERRLEERNMALRAKEKKAAMIQEGPKIVKHKGSLTVGELSQQIGVTVAEIIKYLLGLGIMATINHSLDSDAIELIASEYNAEVQYEEVVDESDLSVFFEVEDDEKDMQSRPPVITIMGHVDHGKTTLLDTIRKANVADGESGGITQHIGAYQIKYGEKKLTFLDTPGHEAFTSMRARGAQITDIAIIVVAADDGVMPQTQEAVEHAKAAGVPIIVAVNKIDKPGANPTVVMQGLTELGLQPEAWGGETIFVEISAKMGTNIDELLEMILLVAEVQELKANPNRQAFGTVIEARLDKGRGAVATLLVQGGTLSIGDPVVVGNTYGRVRTMEDDKGKRLKTAPPSTPVELTGLMDVPSAGDQFAVFESEKKARQIGEARGAMLANENRRKSSAMNLEDLNRQILEGEIKDINVIVKGDVQGSVEAVVQSFSKIDVQGVRVKIVRDAVGGITESDVMLAIATNAIIYGFNVRPDANTRQVAEAEGVTIRLHSIIYKAIEELEQAMNGMLDPEYEEVVTGQAEVRQIFKVSKIGTIAGCMVTSGELKRDSLVRLIRNSIIVYDGKLGSLKREQDDAKTVATGYECGLTIEGYNDIKEGDIVEGYEMQEIKRKK